MISVRRSGERGGLEAGWLKARYTFSFSSYFDPAHMGFRALRVINEDRIAPGGGFGMHPHADMEIITYVLEGSLEHKDSLGSKGVITAGEIQHMTAGTGIRHSEYNPSRERPAHLYQIWIEPDREGYPPSYSQTAIAPLEPGKDSQLRLLASPDGSEGSITIRRNAKVYVANITSGGRLELALDPDRHAWVQTVRGEVELNGHRLVESDGAAVSGESKLTFSAAAESEMLIFDLD